jgi:hypothetical protein
MIQVNNGAIARPWPALRRRQRERQVSRGPLDAGAKALALKRREARAQAVRAAALDSVVWNGRSFL